MKLPAWLRLEMRSATKLWLLLGLVASGYLLTTAVNFALGVRTERRLALIESATLPASRAADAAALAYAAMIDEVESAILTGEREELRQADEHVARVLAELARVENAATLDRAIRERARLLRTRLLNYTASAAPVYERLAAGDLSEPIQARAAALARASAALRLEFTAFAAELVHAVDAAHDAVASETRTWRWATLVLFAALALGAGGAVKVEIGKIVARETDAISRDREELEAALTRLRTTQAQLLQAHKLESIGQLAAGIAHEINTPTQYVSDNVAFAESSFNELFEVLDPALAASGAAREGRDAAPELGRLDAVLGRVDLAYVREQVPQALTDAKEGLRRIATIVTAMKDFSHPSDGHKQAVDLADIVRTSVTVARNEWKYVAELTTDFADDLPPVPVLRDEIGQLVLNLVVNAAQAIAETLRPGGREKGRISITTARVGGEAELRVRDDGPGIPEAIRNRVFDPFFTTKPVGRGTGQGLAIAHITVVEKHRGRIWFETAEGRGTCFVVRLPLTS